MRILSEVEEFPSSLKEALELAIRAEIEALQFYTEAARRAPEPEVEALFRQLARDEARHRKLLEAQRDLLLQRLPRTSSQGLMADAHEPRGQEEREQRATERAIALLQEANRTLREAQRLRTEAEAMLVHDFKQPLAAILGFTQTLKRVGGGVSPEELTETLDIIDGSAQRLLALVNDFLELARYESGHIPLELQQVDLAAVVPSLVQALTPQAAARRQQITVALPDLPPVRADVKALTRVLNNLLENALKYTPEGSEVTLTGDYDGLWVWITVRDNGPGIPAEDLPHLFEPFYRGQGQRQASGTGLGLALCQRLVEAQGGRLTVANRENGGAVFSFSLPSDR